MSPASSARLIAVQRALSDPLRVRLYELLMLQPRSAKELASDVAMPPDRLYHHLDQLEAGGLIEIAEYRRLPRGKVERVYAPTAIEPSSDAAAPADIALRLGAALETTRADVNAAMLARESGENRQIVLTRTAVHLNQRHLDELKAAIDELLSTARDRPDSDGVWTAVLWASVDRAARGGEDAGPAPTRGRSSASEFPGRATGVAPSGASGVDEAVEGERQIMVFSLHGGYYGLPLAAVREIIRYMPPRAIATARGVIQGMISLRDRTLPIVDLSSRLGRRLEVGADTRILVIEVSGGALGLIVDTVDGILPIPAAQIEPLPRVAAVDELGEEVATVGQRLIVLINPERALGDLLPGKPTP